MITIEQLAFEGIGLRSIVGAFDGGRLTSDSSVLLLREADRLFDVTARLAACFSDHRRPKRPALSARDHQITKLMPAFGPNGRPASQRSPLRAPKNDR